MPPPVRPVRPVPAPGGHKPDQPAEQPPAEQPPAEQPPAEQPPADKLPISSAVSKLLRGVAANLMSDFVLMMQNTLGVSAEDLAQILDDERKHLVDY
jgi:hypothetical protein